eukprot:4351796-Prymnesium_polylepis.1
MSPRTCRGTGRVARGLAYSADAEVQAEVERRWTVSTWTASNRCGFSRGVGCLRWPMADVVAKGGIGTLRAPC